MLVLNNDGFLLTVREFVEWEYNGGRGDFSRIRHSVLGTIYPLMQKSGMLLAVCTETL